MLFLVIALGVGNRAQGIEIDVDARVESLAFPLALEKNIDALISAIEGPGSLKGVCLVDGEAEPVGSSPEVKFFLDLLET